MILLGWQVCSKKHGFVFGGKPQHKPPKSPPPTPPKFKPLMKDNLRRGIEWYVKKMLVSENFGLILKSQKYF